MRIKTAASFLTLVPLLLAAKTASAGGVNDQACRPAPGKPPVVLVHGQSGNFEGMNGIYDALLGAGYCVFARNYGDVPGGMNGQDHMANSAGQIGGFIDEVLRLTGAQKVNVVGHSAGVGVLDNYIMQKGGAAKVNRAAMFGGLHHPYAHLGMAGVMDLSVYLPNLTEAARKIQPGITIKDVAKAFADMAGAQLSPEMRATMTSDFVFDLFDPDYWVGLQGKLTEPSGTMFTIGKSTRSFTAPDSAPNVCYTNLVSNGDFLVNPATGFQNEAPNIENVLIPTGADHNGIMGDAMAVGKMLASFGTACTPRPASFQFADTNQSVSGEEQEDGEFASKFEDAIRSNNTRTRRALDLEEGGCSATPKTSSSPWMIGVLGVLTAFGGAIRRSFRRTQPRRASNP
jgi:pimeloyl-ACP methyl ester carboxylesterase